jgi:nucleoside-diphosphate-sugar epimerase
MKVLVTGASGFLGRHLMPQLLSLCSAGDVECLVKPAGPDAKPVEMHAEATYRDAGVRLLEGDLSRPLDATPPPAKPDVVFHLAANIDTAAHGPELDVNDLGTSHVLDWLGDRCAGARIVYASSIAVHDRHGLSQGPLSETSPFRPRTDYGRTKYRGEQILQELAPSCGATYTILRLATVYGPDPKPGGLFDTLATCAARSAIAGRLNWPGRTSVIHADDAAALMIALSQRPEAANEIYCVANPDAPTVGELSQLIARTGGYAARPIRVPAVVWRVARRLVCSRAFQSLTPVAQLALWRLSLIVDDGFWCDTSKLQSVWNGPFKPLPEGVADMLAALTELGASVFR